MNPSFDIGTKSAFMDIICYVDSLLYKETNEQVINKLKLIKDHCNESINMVTRNGYEKRKTY